VNARCRWTMLRLGALGLLISAWSLLLFQLNEAPPGFQHDQMFDARDAMRVVNGDFPIYFPDNFGRGPLFMYSAAGVFRLTGGHYVWSLHFTAVIWALLGLATALSFMRRYLSDVAALFAAALMATSFWFLLAGRLGLEMIASLPLATAMFYFLDRGLSQHRLLDFALAGICGGVANYAYLASRTLYLVAPLLAAGVIASLLRQKRHDRPRPSSTRIDLLGLLLTLLVMVATSSPLLLYLASHPGTADARIGQLSGSLNAVLRGDLKPALTNAWDTVRSLLWSGSVALPYHYSVPGRPVLQPILALCLLIGLGSTIVRGRSLHDYLILVVFFVGLGPNLLTGADALHIRAIYVVPVLFLLTTKGLWAILARLSIPRFAATRPEGARFLFKLLPIFILAGLLFWHASSDAMAYFDTWAHAKQTQRIYNADFRAAAAFLDTAATAEEPIFIGTDRLRELDSLTYAFYEPRRNDVNWYDVSDTPPMPLHDDTLYLIPGSAKLPDTLAALAPIMHDRITLPASTGGYDLIRGFRLNADDLATLLRQWGSRLLDEPVIFGDTLRLDAAGMRLEDGHGALITSWTVLAPWPRAARPGYPPARPKVSVSLTDEDGYRWAQEDVTTSLPMLSWEPGQRLLEVTPISLPSDIPPGDYRVRLSMYDDENGPLAMRYSEMPIASTPVVATAQISSGSVAPAPQPSFPIESEQEATGPLRLLGKWEEVSSLFAGLPATVHLSWQANQSIDTGGLTFRVRARGVDGSLLWEQTANPAQPLPETWQAGQVLRLTHRLAPSTANPGETRAKVEICAEQAGTILKCGEIGQPQIVNYTPAMELVQQPEFKTDFRWSEELALAGYDLLRNGQTISLTLYWRAGSAPVTELKRFVHATNLSQAIIAQSDDDLQNHGIPVTLWRSGEYVKDQVALRIPEGGEPTTLYVGLYDPLTGKRMRVQADSGGNVDDERAIIRLE
jgi:hypothetical protein